MKRVGLLLATGALIVGSAASAWAQAAPPPFTVTFNGDIRVLGGASNNTVDFVNTRSLGSTPANLQAGTGSQFKDSFHDFSQRFRLWTNIESGDHHAGARLGFEIGDILWGGGGGASAGDFNGTLGGAPSRVATKGGGALGADGVNVKTKHAYTWFDVPGVPDLRVTLGIQTLEFLTQPTEFFSDDVAGIKVNWKSDPVAVEAWYGRFGFANPNSPPNSPGSNNSSQGGTVPPVDAQSNDAYVGRVWIKPIPDWTFSVEGMLINAQCYDRQLNSAQNARTGPCLKASIGDDFWVGATASGKFLGIGLDGGFVWGQRQLPGAAGSNHVAFKESGAGADVAVTIPINPVTVVVEGWGTSGDKRRSPGSTTFADGTDFQVTKNAKRSCTNTFVPAGGIPNAGCYTGNNQGANAQNNSPLIHSSDKLPQPEDEGGWYTRPLIAEVLLGMQTIGGPPEGASAYYADKTGTFGFGGSAMLAIIPALTVGAGVAYVGASDAQALFGGFAVEVDAGLFYTINANMSVQAIGGGIFPNQGDTAWGAAFRTLFKF